MTAERHILVDTSRHHALGVAPCECCLAFAVDHADLIGAVHGTDVQEHIGLEVRKRIVDALTEQECRLVSRNDNQSLLRFFLNGPDDLEELANLVVTRVGWQPIMTSKGTIHVTLSVGAAKMDGDTVDSARLASWARMALLDAQRTGGAQARVVDPATGGIDWFLAAMETVGWAQRALSEDRFFLAHEPVVRAADWSVDYYECLLRVFDDEGHLVSPGTYISTLERFGVIGRLDSYVFHKVLNELATNPDVSLGCNVSGASASNALWTIDAVSKLRQRPGAARRLVVEITETAPIQNLGTAARFVRDLQALGCRVALDDFGTGFVSIAHLRALGVDIVKIDRSALSGGMGLDGRFGQVGLVAGLARSVGAQVVVEGIEIHEQLQGVQFEDVTHLQGHYFKRAPFARSWRSQNSQMPKRSANSNGER